MQSLSHAIEMANAIELQVNHHLLGGTKPQLDADAAEKAHAAKAKVCCSYQSLSVHLH